jgi:hypothetical protein
MPATLSELNDLVSAEKIKKEFPNLPHPSRVTVLETVDHSGDEAYDIVMVYPDQTPENTFRSDRISAVVDWIRERIFAHRQGERWPYFWFRHESDTKPSRRRSR